MISLSNLPKTVTKKSKRVGRGQSSGRGKNATKGHKGQTKHGGKVRVGFEGGQRSLMKRTPKFNGFRLKNDKSKQTLSLSKIERYYENDEQVDLKTLLEKGLIDEHVKKVRIVNSGNLTKKVQFSEDGSIYLTKGVLSVIR